MTQSTRLSTAFVSPLLGPSLGSLSSPTESPQKRKSLVVDLEDYFITSLRKKEIHECTAKNAKLSQIVSLVSTAIANEKQGMSPIQMEEQFSKVSSKIENMIEAEDVIDNKLIKDWLNMLNFLITKHLQEVVDWVDADFIKEKDPMRSMKNENRDLREEIGQLKKVIEDLQLELDTYKKQSPRKHSYLSPSNSSENPVFNLRTSFSKGSSKDKDIPVDDEEAVNECSERLIDSLTKATLKAQELKNLDQELISILKKEPKNAASNNGTHTQPFMIRTSFTTS